MPLLSVRDPLPLPSATIGRRAIKGNNSNCEYHYRMRETNGLVGPVVAVLV